MACYVFNFNLHDLNLVEIGKQKCTPLYSFGPFIRNEYIFHYVISGKGFCSMGHDYRNLLFRNLISLPVDQPLMK